MGVCPALPLPERRHRSGTLQTATRSSSHVGGSTTRRRLSWTIPPFCRTPTPPVPSNARAHRQPGSLAEVRVGRTYQAAAWPSPGGRSPPHIAMRNCTGEEHTCAGCPLVNTSHERRDRPHLGSPLLHQSGNQGARSPGRRAASCSQFPIVVPARLLDHAVRQWFLPLNGLGHGWSLPSAQNTRYRSPVTR